MTGSIKELIDYSEGTALAVVARAELAEKDARIERLTEALEHIKRHQEIVAGTSVGGLSVTHKIAVAALSGAPTTAKPVPVERLREIDIALRHGHECAQEDLQPTIDYVGSLLRDEIVPPKPTPPPLRVFREGDMPKKADRAS
jgi:ribosomal protein S7